ncbi:hypothetical protein EBB79_11245 [Parasedimentitalea marina]|uniref:Uncharacterized protein n=1 Tax=Parasedimentitalea marina TaxID=2483033 RepID=A0A3T0N324_9RHOB|nr:hypothetical protein EBB79_11245 [Parasedimentitalea marina]
MNGTDAVTKMSYINWLLYTVLIVAIVTCLGWVKPPKFIGFFVSGLAVGLLYALGGIGSVVLFRATGVLNFCKGCRCCDRLATGPMGRLDADYLAGLYPCRYRCFTGA